MSNENADRNVVKEYKTSLINAFKQRGFTDDQIQWIMVGFDSGVKFTTEILVNTIPAIFGLDKVEG